MTLNVPAERLTDRRSLLQQLDQLQRGADRQSVAESRGQFEQQAVTCSSAVRAGHWTCRARIAACISALRYQWVSLRQTDFRAVDFGATNADGAAAD